MHRLVKAGLHKARQSILLRRELRCIRALQAECGYVNPHAIRRVVVIDRYNFIYNWVQKNGSSSLLVLAHVLSSGSMKSPNTSRRRLRQISALDASEIRKLNTRRSLLVTRNPYSRILSAFRDKFRLEKFRARYGEFALTPAGFHDFVLWLEDGNLGRNDHFQPQMTQILLPLTWYSDIIRMENFEQGVRQFLQDVNAPVSELNFQAIFDMGTTHNTRSDTEILAYYDARTQEKVHKLYEMDFATLGYSGNIEDGLRALEDRLRAA